MRAVPEEFKTDIALSTMRSFLLAHSFSPLDGWDANDAHCYRYASFHEIFTLGGKYVGDGTPDVDELTRELEQYYKDLRDLPSSLSQFLPFDCELIETYATGETYLFVSIYL